MLNTQDEKNITKQKLNLFTITVIIDNTMQFLHINHAQSKPSILFIYLWDIFESVREDCCEINVGIMVNCCTINCSKKKRGDDVKGWHIVPYKEKRKRIDEKMVNEVIRRSSICRECQKFRYLWNTFRW